MTTVRVYRCVMCGRRLRDGRWIYSAATGHRFCLDGEGCQR